MSPRSWAKERKAKQPLSSISFPVSSQPVLCIEDWEFNWPLAAPHPLSWQAVLPKSNIPLQPFNRIPLTPSLTPVTLSLSLTTLTSPSLASQMARLISHTLKLYSAQDCAEPSLPQELCACVLRRVRAPVEKTVGRAGIVASEPWQLQFSLLSAALSASQCGQCCTRSLHDEKTASFSRLGGSHWWAQFPPWESNKRHPERLQWNVAQVS